MAARRLYFDLYWGDALQESKSFELSTAKVVAGTSDTAQLPLWGFAFAGDAHTLVEAGEKGVWRVFVPPNATAQKSRAGDRFQAIKPEQVLLSGDEVVRLEEGRIALQISLKPGPRALLPESALGRAAAIGIALLFAGSLIAVVVSTGTGKGKGSRAEQLLRSVDEYKAKKPLL